MTNRRQFIRQTALAGLGAGIGLQSLAATDAFKKSRVMGLQLFTFFQGIDKDVAGTLQKIKAAGYTDIESAFSMKGGFYGMKATEFKKMLGDMGLRWVSHHATGAPFNRPANAKPPVDADGKPISIPPMLNLRDNYQQIIDDVASAQLPYLVCASIPINTGDEVRKAVDILARSGEAAKKAGITFAYHNHDAEFKAVEGIVPYDYFLAQLPADTVKMELDLAWCIKGGSDPVKLFSEHPGRFPLWHVKDLDKEGKVQPVGQGTIDFKRIFSAARKSGMKHFFVEHDFPKDAEASIRESAAYIAKI